jgi:signal transduction histidine kinase
MPECPDLVAVNIYRIVQEALSNVAKHAQVAHVEVTLRFPILAAGKLRPQLQVCVADEGRGFAQYLQSPFNSGSGGLGLVAMHERCQAIDADLMIDSAPGVGTTITVSIELAPAASIESIESASERSTQSM